MINQTELPNVVEFAVREAPTLSSGARVYRVACPHGITSATVVPGRTPLADLAVYDLVLPGHHSRHGCSCVPGLPIRLPIAARA
jgi:hypothetical protein